MTTEQRIHTEENPSRLRCVVVPPEGLALRFSSGEEVYLRSCPKCGARLEVSASSGRMPEWYCPKTEGAGGCEFVREPVSKMSMALASALADVTAEETCHLCGDANLRADVHKRRNRVEIVIRHPAGHDCKAQTIRIFHTFSEKKEIVQQWDEDPGKFDKSIIDNLTEVSPEDAKKMIERSRFEGGPTG